MTLKLHDLRPARGSKIARTRVGRGDGSKGKTAGVAPRHQGPQAGAGDLRGRADADPHAAAQAQGLP